VGFSPEMVDGSGVEKMVRRGSGGAPVAGEGVDEVLQLEEGTGKVRRGPKGVDKGGTGDLTKGERNCGAKTARWRWSGRPARTRGRGERGRGDGVLGHAHEGGREGKERGSPTVMRHPLISGRGRVVDSPRVATSGEGRGAYEAVERRGVAGSGPATALTGDVHARDA
jgi:hypothetical protein